MGYFPVRILLKIINDGELLKCSYRMNFISNYWTNISLFSFLFKLFNIIFCLYLGYINLEHIEHPFCKFATYKGFDPTDHCLQCMNPQICKILIFNYIRFLWFDFFFALNYLVIIVKVKVCVLIWSLNKMKSNVICN